jgi:hypothetical protein
MKATEKEAKSLVRITILDEVVQHDLAIIQRIQGNKFN